MQGYQAAFKGQLNQAGTVIVDEIIFRTGRGSGCSGLSSGYVSSWSWFTHNLEK